MAARRPPLDLEAVELLVRGSMHRAGAEILSRLLSSSSPPASQTPCACGHSPRYHYTRPKQLLTAVGPVRFERGYYLCPHCHQSQYPRDRELDVEGLFTPTPTTSLHPPPAAAFLWRL